MYTKLIDDQINQLEAVMDVHEGGGLRLSLLRTH